MNLDSQNAMAFCYVCAKSKQYGHNVSHSKRRTNRVFKPNVFGKRMLVMSIGEQRTEDRRQNSENRKQKTDINSDIKRIKICAKCLKRAKKYGEVKGKEGAILSNKIIQAVNWEEKFPPEADQPLAEKIEREKKKKDIVKEKITKDKKEERSIKELVGKKKIKKI